MIFARYNIGIIPNYCLCHLVFYGIQILSCRVLAADFQVPFGVVSFLVTAGDLHNAKCAVCAVGSHESLAGLALRHDFFKVLGCGRHDLQHAPGPLLGSQEGAPFAYLHFVGVNMF